MLFRSPSLTRVLIPALPRVALRVLNGYYVPGPLSWQDELGTALGVLWQVLWDAPGPIAPSAIADAVWDDLTDGGGAPFQDPATAEVVVRRDVKQLLVLAQDLDLAAEVDGRLHLTDTGRRSDLPTR